MRTEENQKRFYALFKSVAPFALATSAVFIPAAVVIRLLYTGTLPTQLQTFLTTVVWMITFTAGVMTARRPRQAFGIWLLYVPLAFVAAFLI